MIIQKEKHFSNKRLKLFSASQVITAKPVSYSITKNAPVDNGLRFTCRRHLHTDLMKRKRVSITEKTTKSTAKPRRTGGTAGSGGLLQML